MRGANTAGSEAALALGVAFGGQGAPYRAIARALELHRGHPLVSALRSRFRAPSVAALDLADTRVAQPAIYVAGLTVAQSGLGPRRVARLVVGHSLGELTALAYAGVVSPQDGLSLAIARGEICHAVQRDRPGGMVAVLGLDAGDLEQTRRRVVDDGAGMLEVAAVNGRHEFVLSGDRAAVELVAAYVGTTAARAITLPIQGAFHSSLMAGALGQWRHVLRSVTFSTTRTAVVSCIDGRLHEEPDDFRELLAVALVHRVQWLDAISTVRQAGIKLLWDAGPGCALSRLGRRSSVIEFMCRRPGRPVPVG